jgi:hypothetical protein
MLMSSADLIASGVTFALVWGTLLEFQDDAGTSKGKS